MGRGGAQLGKSIKGKSKDRRKARHAAGGGGGGAVDVNGVELAADGQAGGGDVAADWRALEEYERLAANSELHRRRMNELARQEREYHTANARLLHRLYRQWRRNEKTAEMRAELEVLAANHTADVQRKNRCIAHMQHAIATAHTQSGDNTRSTQRRSAPHYCVGEGQPSGSSAHSVRCVAAVAALVCAVLSVAVSGCAWLTAATCLTWLVCTLFTTATWPLSKRTSTPPLTPPSAASPFSSRPSVSSTLWRWPSCSCWWERWRPTKRRE